MHRSSGFSLADFEAFILGRNGLIAASVLRSHESRLRLARLLVAVVENFIVVNRAAGAEFAGDEDQQEGYEIDLAVWLKPGPNYVEWAGIDMNYVDAEMVAEDAANTVADCMRREFSIVEAPSEDEILSFLQSKEVQLRTNSSANTVYRAWVAETARQRVSSALGHLGTEQVREQESPHSLAIFDILAPLIDRELPRPLYRGVARVLFQLSELRTLRLMQIWHGAPADNALRIERGDATVWRPR